MSHGEIIGVCMGIFTTALTYLRTYVVNLEMDDSLSDQNSKRSDNKQCTVKIKVRYF